MEPLFLQFPMWGMYGCFLAPGMEKRRFCPVSWRFLVHEYLGRRESKKEREIK